MESWPLSPLQATHQNDPNSPRRLPASTSKITHSWCHKFCSESSAHMISHMHQSGLQDWSTGHMAKWALLRERHSLRCSSAIWGFTWGPRGKGQTSPLWPITAEGHFPSFQVQCCPSLLLCTKDFLIRLFQVALLLMATTLISPLLLNTINLEISWPPTYHGPKSFLKVKLLLHLLSLPILVTTMVFLVYARIGTLKDAWIFDAAQ